MSASRTVSRATSTRHGRDSHPPGNARSRADLPPPRAHDASTAPLPLLFGEPPVLAELAVDGRRQPVLGGPADLSPEHWLYLAYGGQPVPSQRKTAEQVMQLAYGPGSTRCSVSVFRPFLAVRSPAGSFLLARDKRGWYVAAIARGVAGPPVRTFGELRRAATWWQSPNAPAA